MRRGDVWWVNLAPSTGRRPVVLLSRNDAYLLRRLVVVAPVTTRVRGIPAEVRLGPDDGLPRLSVANLDTLMTIPLSALRERIASLSSQKLQAIEAAIHYALGLDT